MILPIGNVLSPSEIDEVRIELAAIRFEDGRSTAGWSARLVKNNRQAAPGARSEAMCLKLAEHILANEVFAAAVRPKALTPLLISRYQPGQAYGSHIDDALIGGLRTDVSFTLFLAAPESYEGGELVIEGTSGDERIKLPAGSLIAYPSTSLHHVAPVTAGERLAAVGWARSFIRDSGQREILFDLDRARRALFAREGKTAEFDLLSKSLANLTRMWAED
ncbi:nuclease PIN [Bosea sp. Root483D1]|uniref:Fe2+-dependent dioxygenase n=1 Tax=Bosea sp. Root483D1 TaxID=1736544 RepID=UPI00070AA1F8|nr:Fe2+-dependent dioxygenase [Bosea sp. Root483D1]KRE13185.1 nuclease PIN [Bosea sp. Root483D1]